MPSPVRILGIDPGLRITGYALLHAPNPSDFSSTPRIIEAGVIRLRPPTNPDTPPAHSIADRLLELERDLAAIIERLAPDLAAVEAVFAHTNHPATAITMGHARGVVLLTLRRAALNLAELKPAEVKKALTGSGRATKDQMQRAVQTLFALPTPPEPPDVADAIAIALGACRRTALETPQP
ncbi:MAG: crossover junction endodeoxyribonuclease RuvC [Phycisphaeraceae bacterium]|nr:crossover junction endodeoxyribonuclease RuvC [Phycisphaeraceae bacterium]